MTSHVMFIAFTIFVAFLIIATAIIYLIVVHKMHQIEKEARSKERQDRIHSLQSEILARQQQHKPRAHLRKQLVMERVEELAS